MKLLASLFVALMAASAHAEVTVVDVDALAPLIEQGIPLVDVRNHADQVETGIVPGARPIGFFDDHGEQQPAAWMASLKPVAGPDDPVILICRSGAKARMAADYLDKHEGYRKVYAVEGGVIGWKALGHPVAQP
ncbi:MAG: rhodanese-like domain-containing protein [Rhodocyclaceae bacterium]|nr:rhodanese-like domain-containing protein [Rhodocyclaceae bacterium]